MQIAHLLEQHEAVLAETTRVIEIQQQMLNEGVATCKALVQEIPQLRFLNACHEANQGSAPFELIKS